MRKNYLLLVVLFVFINVIHAQNIIYVTPNGTGNGSSWATATGNLQAAINSAATQTPKPDIWVAAGTYYGDSISTHNAFTMKDGVDVYGGFAGNEPADYDLNLRNFETNETALDGQYVQPVLLQEVDFADTTTWDGFTIRNGYDSDEDTVSWLVTGADLMGNSVLRHCNITNNKSSSSDYFAVSAFRIFLMEDCNIFDNEVGISLIYSTLTNCNVYNNSQVGIFSMLSTITDCNIFNNNRGGVNAYSCTLTNCNISNNNMRNLSGGGLSAHYSNIDSCTISGNIVVQDTANTVTGGGLIADNSTVSNCIINDNSIEGTNVYGGGVDAFQSIIKNCDIYNNHSDNTAGGINTSDATVIRCKIHNNNSDFDGGGATFQGGTISNCEIHNNSATRCAGGAELYSATLYNCNIYNNVNTGTTPQGSGVYASTSTSYDNLPATLINCNIVNNLASGTTGGIYNKPMINTIHNIFTNCIVWGNRDNDSSEQIEIAGGVGDFSYCAVEGGWTGTGNVNLATANYGNNSALHYVNFHTPTIGAGADYDGGNWVLQAGSACIDTGTPDTAGLNLPATDLLGFSRIYNNRIDIGANEYFPGTSIHEYVANDLSNNILLFPNPATNFVELQITN